MNAIGVFDSGVGGLSVLRALRAELPLESFIYIGDNGHSPYGERDDAHVIGRAIAITHYLIEQHDIKALVVACNTATAAAIGLLRQRFDSLPIIGIEPALKPASKTSKTHRIGVIATAGTIGSEKFRGLLNSNAGSAEFVLQPCAGLATAIESNDSLTIDVLCKKYANEMGTFGTAPGQIDTLVLGCTHYPFASDALKRAIGSDVDLIDGGAPVAAHTRRLLEKLGRLENSDETTEARMPSIQYLSTGNAEMLRQAIQRWFGEDASVTELEQV